MRTVLQVVILLVGIHLLLDSRRVAQSLVRSERRAQGDDAAGSVSGARRASLVAGGIFVFASIYGLLTDR